MTALYPLRFGEILRNYRFGNRWIPQAFPAKAGLPEHHHVAETWEICDRPEESSEVVNGPLRGVTLHEVIRRYGERLLGSAVVNRTGLRFPLLIKLLDCSNELSAQAHHSDQLAKREGLDDPGKTEAWYMLRVKPGASIRCGNAPGVTREHLRKAILSGTAPSCMNKYSVKPHDAFLLYAGTMHHSDGGVLFYEIMQNSDVYIGLGPVKDRSPRQRDTALRIALEGTHLEEGFDCRPMPVVLDESGARRTIIMACRYFALERIESEGDYAMTPNGDTFEILSQIEGESVVRYSRREERLAPGNTIMLPASLGTTTVSGVQNSAFLRAYVPDLTKNVVQPLRNRGISNEAIVALGGNTTLNPLRELVA